MPYTVTWDPAAQDELARIWLDASDQQAVADASDLIDARLRLAPESLGQRCDGYRRYTVDPLTVAYTVFPDDCKVEVLYVWRSS